MNFALQRVGGAAERPAAAPLGSVADAARPLSIVCLVKRIAHHSPSGGYDQLARHVGGVAVSGPSLQSGAGRLTSAAWSHGRRSEPHHPNYRLSDRIAEEAAFWTARRRGADIVHALYGEEQLNKLLLRTKKLPGALIATFHLPLAQVRDNFARLPDAVMRRLSGVVLVGSGDVAGFEDWIGAGKVMFVPHGIDTTAFHPAPREAGGRPRFLFVGWHMRDFETAHLAMDRCARAGLDVQFDVVVRPDKNAFFTGCPNVTFHANLSEAELLGLYQQADALFLPLIDATANNAVLEALACGTPVITSDVGSLRDYMDERCGWLLTPGDPSAAFECLAAIVADPGLAALRRAPARARAEELAWPVVAADLLAGYARLVAGERFAL